MFVNEWRIKYTVLYSVEKGRFFVIDNDKRRFQKMCVRLDAFEQIVKVMYPVTKYRMVHVTLTYAEMDTWAKGDLSQYINSLRGFLKESLVAFCWIGGMQLPRRALHYHVVIVVPIGTNVPKPDKRGHWKHGMTKMRTWKSMRYFMRYFEKFHELEAYPKGYRLVGYGFEDWSIRDAFSELVRLNSKKGSPGQWRYVGSAVTKEYAENVLAKETILG